MIIVETQIDRSSKLRLSMFNNLKVALVSLPNSVPITLDQFLKQTGIVGSGGQAKILIQAGDVLLNGVVEKRRGKKLAPGDIVTVGNEKIQVPIDS